MGAGWTTTSARFLHFRAHVRLFPAEDCARARTRQPLIISPFATDPDEMNCSAEGEDGADQGQRMVEDHGESSGIQPQDPAKQRRNATWWLRTFSTGRTYESAFTSKSRALSGLSRRERTGPAHCLIWASTLPG